MKGDRESAECDASVGTSFTELGEPHADLEEGHADLELLGADVELPDPDVDDCDGYGGRVTETWA